jgi:hypothetical protein
LDRVARAGLPAPSRLFGYDIFGFLEKLKMDFQVNEQTYFLSLAEDAKQWEVFVSTPAGAMSIPVYVDAAESESLVVIQEGKGKRRLVN